MRNARLNIIVVLLFVSGCPTPGDPLTSDATAVFEFPNGEIVMLGNTAFAPTAILKQTSFVSFSTDSDRFTGRSPFRGNTSFYSGAMEMDGDLIISGGVISTSGLGSRDRYLAKIDRSGHVIWERRYKELANALIYHAVEIEDGSIRLVGGLGGVSLFLGEIDPRGDLSFTDLNYAVKASTIVGDFDVIVGATDYDSRDVRLTKVSWSHLELWTATYPFAGEETVAEVMESRNSDILVVGGATGEAVNPIEDKFLVLRTTAAGSLVWMTTFDRPQQGFRDGVAIVESQDSSIYIGGPDSLLKLDTDGNLVWRIVVNGTISDLTMARDGTILAVGQQFVSPDPRNFITRMLLLKVDPEGSVLLERTYDGVPYN